MSTRTLQRWRIDGAIGEDKRPTAIRPAPLNKLSTNEHQAVIELGLERTVTELHKLGKNVVIVRSVPEIGYDVPSAALAAEMTGRNINNIISPSVDEHVERTKEVTYVFSNIRNKFDLMIVDPAQRLCESGLCQVIEANYLLYRDDDHLSTYGSKYASNIFDPYLNKTILKIK